MGKAQSKRSVDITTENKDGVAVAEGESGKVGKIEDVDQKPQLNGDANKEAADSGTNETKDEKKDDAENEKDAVTEKSEQPAAVAEKAVAEPAAAASAAAAAAEPAATEPKAEEKPTENGDGTGTDNAADTTTGTLDESKDGAENAGDGDASSTPATDSAKKAKKEKSKKRFLSFRSFSFSKKDKTKPKKEEAAAAAATNGDCEKVPEEGTEDAAAAAAAAAAPSGDEKADAAPVTNGTTEEVKTNGEQAPVATPEESVTPPSNGDSKPIIEAAKQTVNEVIVAASKSVDEKLNAVAKPEVNKNADQDLLPHEIHTQALDTVVINEQKHEHEHEQSSEKNANIDTVQNNSVDIVTTTGLVGVVDCTTNNSSNNDNIHSQSAPPLPVTPPPSQITVFATSAMSVENVENSIPQTIVPIIQSKSEIQVSGLAEVADDNAKVDDETAAAVAATIVVDNVIVNDGDDDKKSEVVDTQSQIEAPIESLEANIEATQAATECEIAPVQIKPDAEIAETIAILDRVNLNESDQKVSDESNVVVESADGVQEPQPEPEPEPISVDISSPLPQHSLDTLPSPQSLSSNVTPPNECDDESVTVELAQEDESTSLPPPPADDVAMLEANANEIHEQSKHSDDDLLSNGTHNGNDDLVLPPPPAAVTDEAEADAQDSTIENDIRDELKTNGTNAMHHSVEALSGDGILNGSSKNHDEAANNISDKANGVANDNSVSEKLNGDHKTIEEIATSPEKLEKLAAANPPPSTEVVAAE